METNQYPKIPFIYLIIMSPLICLFIRPAEVEDRRKEAVIRTCACKKLYQHNTQYTMNKEF